MSDSRIDEAIGRIENALVRIERQAALRHASGSGIDGTEALRRQNGDLRDAISRSLAQLDDLIAGIEQ